MATPGGAMAPGSAFEPVNPWMFTEPQDTATIIVEGKVFKVYQALLVKDSPYFEQALSASFAGGQKKAIEVDDDIDAFEFGIYVDVLYRSFFTENFQLRPAHCKDNAVLSYSVRLWKLGDRFFNQTLCEIADEALSHVLDNHFSVAAWENAFNKTATAILRKQIVNLQAHFRFCARFHIPYQESFADRASNMPSQLFTECRNDLDKDFSAAVLKMMMKRFEKPGVMRRAETDDEDGSPAKKHKQG